MVVSITSSKASFCAAIANLCLIIRLGDTVLHSWEVLAKILSSDITMNIVCDIGMCVLEITFPDHHAQHLNEGL
jgi:hypothetical protein